MLVFTRFVTPVIAGPLLSVLKCMRMEFFLHPKKQNHCMFLFPTFVRQSYPKLVYCSSNVNQRICNAWTAVATPDSTTVEYHVPV